MSLVLYMHPLSSYCHKALIALYENATPFRAHCVDLGNTAARGAFAEIWPLAKFPVLRDESRSVTVPESTSIIEYLDCYYPGAVRFIPQEHGQALRVRALDRLLDLHLHESMGKIVTDRLRPSGSNDVFGVEQARERLRIMLEMFEREFASRQWAAGDAFSLADCAAAAPLFFIDRMAALSDRYPVLHQYFQRIKQRPSYARVLAEAAPYMKHFPG